MNLFGDVGLVFGRAKTLFLIFQISLLVQIA
jgi:hypothetical protein